MQIVFALCAKFFLVAAEDTCGTWVLPKEPVHFNPAHGSQWRLLATEGQKLDGTIIKGIIEESTYPTVIRGHWAIGELEFYSDPHCKGKKYPTLVEDGPALTPLMTTYGWQDDAPAEHPFLAQLGSESPWYSEMRAIDGCYSSEFWSQCYQCDGTQAWYGVRFDKDEKDVTQIKCIKMFQKDADAYTATRVQLERWLPTTIIEDSDGNVTNVTVGHWKKLGDWTGLNGGRWYVLQHNTTAATAGAHESAVPSCLGLVGLLLWSML